MSTLEYPTSYNENGVNDGISSRNGPEIFMNNLTSLLKDYDMQTSRKPIEFSSGLST